MAITLSRLCADTEKTYGLKLIAGQNGLKNYVRWVHMVEDKEVPDFLHGDELVFTTGIGQRGVGWIVDFIKNLRAHGAAGLVINLGPYITEVPPQAIVYCEKNGFPLFTMPWKVHIIDVTYDFCHRIVASEKSELGIAAAFSNLIFTPKNSEASVEVLKRNGFHEDSNYVITAIYAAKDGVEFTQDEWAGINFLIRRTLKNYEGQFCLFVQENRLIIIRRNCTVSDAVSSAEAIVSKIKHSHPGSTVCAGVSNMGMGLDRVPACYKNAVSAMKVAKIKDKVTQVYDNIGVYKLILGVEDISVLRDFQNDVLGTLIESETVNKTDYLSTLFCYLQNNSSIQTVADIMGVHRNTINYKMKCIKEALKLELTDENKANFLLAFYIKELLEKQ